MSFEDFIQWLEEWNTFGSNALQMWLPLRRACIEYWHDCPEFRDFVRSMIEQGRPEEVLCWVSEHM